MNEFVLYLSEKPCREGAERIKSDAEALSYSRGLSTPAKRQNHLESFVKMLRLQHTCYM